MTLTRDDAHVYRVDGRIVKSVTQILKAAGVYELGGSPEQLEYSRWLGRHVHAATQFDDEGDLNESALDPVITPYLDAWRAFKSDVRFTVTANEQFVYSDEFDYAGQLDRLGLMYGRLSLLDLKTGAQQRATGLQLSAYHRALPKSIRAGIEGRFALHLHPGNGRRPYTLIPYKERTDFAVFQAAMNLARWKENGK